MKKSTLPILICHANCPQCRLPTDFKVFESGLGGDFETYVGAESGSIYRLDLGQIHYQGKPRSALLAEALANEGRLTCIPKEIRCKICGTEFSATSVLCDGEEQIEAYQI